MPPKRLLPLLSALIAVAVLAAGCSAPAVQQSASPAPSQVGATGAFTPLTASVITPPSPVPGSDGSVHFAFELLVTNTSPRAATLTRVLITDAANSKGVISDLAGATLLDRTILAGDLAVGRTTAIPAYATVLVIVDGVSKPGESPHALQTHLTAEFAPPGPDQPLYVSIFPDTVTEDLPGFPVSTQPVPSIGPPLAGGAWLTLNACCTVTAHRATVLGRDGTLVAPERYAIDFSRVGDNGDLFIGDSHTIGTDTSYNAELLAVGDGTVVAVSDDLPDQPIGVNPAGYSLQQLAGNQIVLRLDSGIYALYAHNVPGSPRVKVGDHVKKGQVLALLGNSGNSTAPHLHFHLMATPEPLNSDGIPFTWDGYLLLGQTNSSGIFGPLAKPEPQQHVYALASSAVQFPGVNTGNFGATPDSESPGRLPQDVGGGGIGN